MSELYRAQEDKKISCEYTPHIDLIPSKDEDHVLSRLPSSTPNYPRAKPFSGTKVYILNNIFI